MPAPATPAAPSAPAATTGESYRQKAVLAGRQGHVAGACKLLEQSVAAGAPLNVVDELGRCRSSEGNRPAAMSVYGRLERAAELQGAPRWASHAKAQQASLAPSLARLTIRLEGAPQIGMTVKDNQTPLPLSNFGQPRWVEPGPHDVVLTRIGGDLIRQSVTLQPGQSTAITLSLAPAERSSAGKDSGSAGRSWGSVLAGLGAASLGIGVALTLVGSSLVDEFDVACAENLVDCTDPAFLSARDNGESLVEVGVPMIIGGSVAVVGGIVLVLTHLPSNDSSPNTAVKLPLDLRVAPWVSPSPDAASGGLSVSGRF